MDAGDGLRDLVRNPLGVGSSTLPSVEVLASRVLSTTLVSDDERPRLPASASGGNGDRSPKKPLADHCLSTLGDKDRAVRL